MYIINLFIIITCIVYIIFLSYVIFKGYKKTPFIVTLFIIYSALVLISLTTITDLFYFYLMYKLLNICIYIILIQFSNQALNFKALTYYYFLSFISSLLFITSLYNITENFISLILINFAILIKLSITPFCAIIAYVYSNSSFLSFLTLSYIINFYYIYILYIINQQNYIYIVNNYQVMYTIIILSILIIIQIYYNFNKQFELKGFTALSSMTNIPIIVFIVMIPSLFTNLTSTNTYDILIMFFFTYLIIYQINYLIICTMAINLQPVMGKR